MIKNSTWIFDWGGLLCFVKTGEQLWSSVTSVHFLFQPDFSYSTESIFIFSSRLLRPRVRTNLDASYSMKYKLTYRTKYIVNKPDTIIQTSGSFLRNLARRGKLNLTLN